jgi:hypothetical protein
MSVIDLRASRPLVRPGWEFADATARDAETLTDADIGFVCRVAAPLGYFLLRQRTPSVVWEQIGGGGAAPGPTLWTPANLSPVASIWLDTSCDRVVKSGVSRLVSRTSTPHLFQRLAGENPALSRAGQVESIRFDSASLGSRLASDEGAVRNLSRACSYAAVLAVYRLTATGTVQRCLLSMTTATGGSSRFVALLGGDSPNNNRPGLIVRRLDADGASTLFDSADRGVGWQLVLWEMNYGSRLGRIWRNGEVSVSNATLTTAGETSDTQSNAAIGLGAFVTDISGTALHIADADLAALVARFGTTALSTDDVDRLFGWAAHAYSLTGLLPSAHPFKTTPPTITP